MGRGEDASGLNEGSVGGGVLENYLYCFEEELLNQAWLINVAVEVFKGHM